MDRKKKEGEETKEKKLHMHISLALVFTVQDFSCDNWLVSLDFSSLSFYLIQFNIFACFN